MLLNISVKHTCAKDKRKRAARRRPLITAYLPALRFIRCSSAGRLDICCAGAAANGDVVEQLRSHPRNWPHKHYSCRNVGNSDANGWLWRYRQETLPRLLVDS